MLHQPITTAAASDPDLAAAVSDFRNAVIEIRRRSARLIGLPVGSAARDDDQAAIEALLVDMEGRAERIAVPIDDLFRAINADLAGRREDVAQPHGALLTQLLDENTRAHAAEAQAHRALTAAQDRVARAGADRLAADRACAGYAAGWALRGQMGKASA